jgi:hypothetical protein
VRGLEKWGQSSIFKICICTTRLFYYKTKIFLS